MNSPPKPSVPDQAYPYLFSPIKLAGHNLKNRIVHASMTSRFATAGKVTQQFIDYHLNRIEGGAAMTITEPLGMIRWRTEAGKIAVYDRADEEGLRRIAAAISDAGGLLLGQVQDSGRGHRVAGRNDLAIGASALADDLSWTIPVALSSGEVKELITDFTASASFLKECGWHGVEISAGHGHLFHQFFSARSNRREDEYGGSLENRCRLVTELMSSIRLACGDEFIIGVKLPGEDGISESIDLEEAMRISKIVASHNIADFVTFCWGTHGPTLDWHVPDLNGPRTPYADKIAKLASPFRKSAAIGLLGLVTDPNEAEKFLADGNGNDLVMLGRPLVTDPAWGMKAEAGREADIRYCVSCNTCWHMITQNSVLQCDNNPRVGASDEADWQPIRAKNRKRVTIVGSGPASMECAWVAAARGHEVTVFGQSGDPGGKTRLQAELPGGENLSSVYDYQSLMAGKHNVKLELGVVARTDEILQTQPDEIVLATGSTMTWPIGIPADYRDEGVFLDIRTLMRELVGRAGGFGGTVVIYDHDHTRMTYAAAEFLAQRYDRVVMATLRESFAVDEPTVVKQGIFRRLHKLAVDFVPFHDLDPRSAYEDGAVDLVNIHSGVRTTIDDVALLTYATPRQPNIELLAPLKQAGFAVHRIGDALSPRTLRVATSEGYALADKI